MMVSQIRSDRLRDHEVIITKHEGLIEHQHKQRMKIMKKSCGTKLREEPKPRASAASVYSSCSTCPSSRWDSSSSIDSYKTNDDDLSNSFSQHYPVDIKAVDVASTDLPPKDRKIHNSMRGDLMIMRQASLRNIQTIGGQHRHLSARQPIVKGMVDGSTISKRAPPRVRRGNLNRTKSYSLSRRNILSPHGEPMGKASTHTVA